MEGCGAYIGATPARQATRPDAASDIKPLQRCRDLIKMNLF
jgi:hypothetical protein